MTVISSSKRTLRTLAALVVLGVSSNPAVAGGLGGTPVPVITSVSTTTDPARLTLRGNALGDSPAVFLGAHQLQVTHTSEREIVARLPADLAPAAYRLVVRNRSQRSEPFTLQVGAN